MPMINAKYEMPYIKLYILWLCDSFICSFINSLKQAKAILNGIKGDILLFYFYAMFEWSIKHMYYHFLMS